MNNIFQKWFQSRWGEPAPTGSAPKYTDAHLQEAFRASATNLASALNDHLAKHRTIHADPLSNPADKKHAETVITALLELAREADFPLTSGPSGEWVEEEALKAP